MGRVRPSVRPSVRPFLAVIGGGPLTRLGYSYWAEEEEECEIQCLEKRNKGIEETDAVTHLSTFLKVEQTLLFLPLKEARQWAIDALRVTRRDVKRSTDG